MIKRLFERANRGVLLDVIVFLVNVVLMTLLSRQLANLFRQANAQVPLAQAAVGLFCIGLVFLQPIGAILRRRQRAFTKP